MNTNIKEYFSILKKENRNPDRTDLEVDTINKHTEVTNQP